MNLVHEGVWLLSWVFFPLFTKCCLRYIVSPIFAANLRRLTFLVPYIPMCLGKVGTLALNLNKPWLLAPQKTMSHQNLSARLEGV